MSTVLPERIKLRGSDDPVDMFLIEAMLHDTELGDHGAIDRYFPDRKAVEPYEAEVSLTINGIPVPFKAVANGFAERMNAEFNARVLAKAQELISEAGLERIPEVLRDTEWLIREALAAAQRRLKAGEKVTA